MSLFSKETKKRRLNGEGWPYKETIGPKRCPKCNEVKELSEFYRNKRSPNRKCAEYQCYCKPCTRIAAKEYRDRVSPEKRYLDDRTWSLGKYGMAVEDRDKLLLIQNGKCPICGTSEPGGKGDWHVDHCHETGEVRGLLCVKCNPRLGGGTKEQIELLERMINYLKSGGPAKGMIFKGPKIPKTGAERARTYRARRPLV